MTGVDNAPAGRAAKCGDRFEPAQELLIPRSHSWCKQ